MIGLDAAGAGLHGCVALIAAQWEVSLETVARKSMAASTTKERATAYARTSAVALPESTADQAAITQFIARLAADRLWMYEALTGKKLSHQERNSISEQIVGVIESGSERDI